MGHSVLLLQVSDAGDGIVQLALQPIVVRLDLQERVLVLLEVVQEGEEAHLGVVLDQGRLAPDDVIVGGQQREGTHCGGVWTRKLGGTPEI